MLPRRKCKKLCCKNDSYIKMLYEKGYTQKKIGEMCGSSHRHISTRLMGMGVRMRGRKDYEPSRGGRKDKTHPFWKISEKMLRTIPLTILCEELKVGYRYGWEVKRRRLDESRGSEETN